MDSQKEYSFLYVNSIIFAGLLFGSALAWLAAVARLEALLYANGARLPSYLTPLALLSGMALGYLLIRRRLCFLYVFQGRGRILEDGFELRLRYKACRIPFGNIRRMFYKKAGRGRGMVVSAGAKSLYLEEPPFPPPDRAGEETLLSFYLHLEAAWLAQKQRAARD